MTTLVGLAFIAAGVVRLDLLEKVQGDILAMALAIALVVLGVLSIASYAVVRAIEWASCFRLFYVRQLQRPHFKWLTVS